MRIDLLQKDQILFLLLCSLSFGIFFVGSSNSFLTSTVVALLEIIFVVFYILLFGLRECGNRIRSCTKVTRFLLAAFLFTVTLAMLLSPYRLWAEELGRIRYFQTLAHILFFATAYCHFSTHYSEFRIRLMFICIPASGVSLALLYVLLWNVTENPDSLDWFWNPPLAAHIRHIGYLITAAASVSFVFLVAPSSPSRTLVIYLIALITTTFLFWTGGRSAAVSLLGALLVLLTYLGWAKILRKLDLFTVLSVLALAVLLSSGISVQEWNGMTQAAARSSGTASANALLSGRIDIWKSTLDSLQGHWFFGLGPQGYYFMPNRIFGVQPHSMILQFVTEWGLAGTAVFFTLMARAVTHMARGMICPRQPLPRSFLCSISVLTSLTIHGLVDGTYYHGQPGFYLVLSLAVCMAYLARHESRGMTRNTSSTGR